MRLLAFAALIATVPAFAALRYDELEDGAAQLALAKAALDAAGRIAVDGDPAYAPYAVDCPANITWVRPASQGVGEGEKKYLEQRSASIDAAVKALVAAHNMSVPVRRPIIGVAMSGGGFRAMINTMGMTMGLMNGSAAAAKAGTAGWLDATSYISGLSGGSWAVGSFVANGGPLPSELVSTWNLKTGLLAPANNTAWWANLAAETRAKRAAGFPTQIADVWSLALGDHLLPPDYRTDVNPNLTFSQLPQVVPAFANASVPFPIIIASSIDPSNQKIIPIGAPSYEFTPYEFGTWQTGDTNKTEGFFSPIEYLGTPLSNGQPSNGTCVKGFDQMSFVMGVSSTLFNVLPINASSLFPASAGFSDLFDPSTANVATFPNVRYEPGNGGALTGSETLTLVDAGETGQNLPLEPLLVPARNVDAIIAFDSGADTTFNWPNGSALYTTQEAGLARMPKVPSPDAFVTDGLNTRPTFFGCDQYDHPLIVYVPNYPWSTFSNTSTLTLAYTDEQVNTLFANAEAAMTLNGTVASWGACLACALLDRAAEYTAENRTDTCKECFKTYCWNGTVSAQSPPGEFEPAVGPPSFVASLPSAVPSAPAPSVSSFGARERTPAHWSLLLAIVAVAGAGTVL